MAQVVSQDNLILQRRKWKDNGQCVVFVAGCFDLLHPGHIRLLEQARSHGDILVVGVQSDASVRHGMARQAAGVMPHRAEVDRVPSPRLPSELKFLRLWPLWITSSNLTSHRPTD